MKNNLFSKILFLLFIIFLALYFSANVGIIDYQARNKTILTEQQIKQFESDIKNNVNIDISNYNINNEKKYSNSLSKATLKLSNKIGVTINNILNYFFKKIEKNLK